MKGFEWLAERWLTKDKLDKVKKLAAVADDLSITMAQLSIAWCLKNPHVSTVILGATQKNQLVDNLGSMDALEKLTPEVMAKIEKIVATKPILPAF
jgi:aryl-alcohol dehydrogenase-like predicted oxidoreductase